LRIVGERGPDADDNGVNDGAKTMQMRKPGRAVDVMGMTAARGDAAIERLADLTHNNQPVRSRASERPENLLPHRRQRRDGITDQRGHVFPRISIVRRIIRTGSVAISVVYSSVWHKRDAFNGT
jgi:hypothetical protein